MIIITAYGLPGYGPNAADDNFGISTTWQGAADELRRMLDESAEGKLSEADALAEHGNYEDAWKTRKHADAMGNLYDNLSNSRASAPLYAGDPGLWAAEIERIVGENFPYDVDSGCRIYCWESADFGIDECPCCKRPADLLALVCDECVDAGDLNQEFATPEMPYPYCAATDSSPLASADGSPEHLAAIAGECSHGGHGWDGDTCSDIPTA